MAFTRYASFDASEILDLKGAPTRSHVASLDRISDFDNYRTGDGYLYVRIRAISSRVNRNHDGWPSVELAGSPEIFERHHSGSGFTVEASEGNQEHGFATFIGKPIFVDHHNSSPKRARGVIVDAKLNVLDHKTASVHDSYWGGHDVDSEHLPPTEVELLLEVDAKAFPKLAKAIQNGDLDGFSMGCFLPGTPITLEDGTHKVIEEIQSGDRVITHTGKVEPVTHTMKRAFSGPICEVTTYGQAEPMRITDEHPVWIKRTPSAFREKHNDNCECRCGRIFKSRRALGYHLREVKRWDHPGEHSRDSSETIGWIEAKDLQVGDYVLTPHQDAVVSVPEALARLLGYYLAEGNVGYDKTRYPDGRSVFVEWNFNQDEEEYIQDVRDALETLGYSPAGPYVKNSCATIRCNNPELSQEFVRLGGKYSWAKRLATEVLSWDPTALRSLLTAYFAGDGTQADDRSKQAGTASKTLADQLYLVGIKAGVRLTPPTHQHSPSAQANGHRAKYVLQTPSLDQEPDDRSLHSAYLDPDGLWRRITSIRLLEYEGNVYNFDVEGDHSYIAANAAVHNCDVEHSKCSHCGHIATNPEEYCSHIMMKGAHHDFKTADGKRVSRKSYENCYGIQFFEISAVFDPADETALAREVRASIHKEADAYTGIIDDAGQPRPTAVPDPVNTDWRNEEVEALAKRLMDMHKYDPETALSLAQERIDMQHPLPGHGEGRRPHAVTPLNATPAPSGGVIPSMPAGYDPRMSSRKTAQNPLPQDLHVRAPDDIDTLREEELCPICGNIMDSETCSVCGEVRPPKEFDNPDLNKAKEIREKMKQEEEQQATQGPSTQPGMDPGAQIGEPQKPGGPLTSQLPSKAPATAHVTNDMRWTPKVHPKTAARINQVERPVTPSPQPVSDEPSNVVVTKDQTRPITSAMTTAQKLIANAQRNHGDKMKTRTADGPTPPGDTSPKTRVDVTGVGGVDEASNEAASKADATVDVTGIGTTGISDVAADKTESLPTAGKDGDDSGFDKTKTTEDSGPTKTYGDSDGSHSGVGDPVTSEPFPASEDGVKAAARLGYDDKTLEQNEQQGDPVAQGGSAVKGVQPIAESFGDRVNLLEHKTSPSNNSGPTTTWTGTDGNGVLKQQDPITHEDQEWGGVKVPDVKLHTGRVSIAALRLAEAELELGLIAREERWNRVAEVDAMHPAIVQAKLEELSRVKTAGLNRLAQTRQASLTRLPKAFGKQTAAPDGFQRIATGAEHVERQGVTDETLDAGLFLK